MKSIATAGIFLFVLLLSSCKKDEYESPCEDYSLYALRGSKLDFVESLKNNYELVRDDSTCMMSFTDQYGYYKIDAEWEGQCTPIGLGVESIFKMTSIFDGKYLGVLFWTGYGDEFETDTIITVNTYSTIDEDRFLERLHPQSREEVVKQTIVNGLTVQIQNNTFDNTYRWDLKCNDMGVEKDLSFTFSSDHKLIRLTLDDQGWDVFQ